MWCSIKEWSKEKADAWLAHTDGRFKYKVQEQITRGKKPNLANQSKDFQDIGNEHIVWVMACSKVWAWPGAGRHMAARCLGRDLKDPHDQQEKEFQGI